MFDIFVQIIFGWPAMITSLLVSVIGLIGRKPWLLVAGGVIIIPFAWYLSGYPAIRISAIILPVFQLVSAWALRREKRVLAWVLLAPLAIIMLMLAIAVLAQ